jgi:hypothetical protein
MFNHAFFVWEVGLEHNNKQIVSDMSEGVIRNPLAFNFPIQRGFSGSIQTLPIAPHTYARAPLVYVISGYVFHYSSSVEVTM